MHATGIQVYIGLMPCNSHCCLKYMYAPKPNIVIAHPTPEMNDKGRLPQRRNATQPTIVKKNLKAPSIIVAVYLSISAPES